MPSLILYAVIFLAVAGAIGGAYSTVKKSGYTEAVNEYQPKLDAAQQQIKAQNEAVEKLRQEASRKASEGARALKDATARGKVWEDNALRLQAAIQRKDAPSDCGSAWRDIRGGK